MKQFSTPKELLEYVGTRAARRVLGVDKPTDDQRWQALGKILGVAPTTVKREQWRKRAIPASWYDAFDKEVGHKLPRDQFSFLHGEDANG